MSSVSAEKKQQQASEFKAWKKSVLKYQTPSLLKTSWQLLSSLGFYIALWALMYFTVQVSWWLTIPLAVIAGGMLIRTFIVFHDCGHGSAFQSKRANTFWGRLCGLVTFTPYQRWRWEHARHHATSGNLDRRGTGDIWTMTVTEYQQSSRWKKFAYRLIRNPIVLFGIGPIFLLLVMERIPTGNETVRERQSVWWTNLGVVIMVASMIYLFGFFNYLVLQLITLAIAGSAGIWLFYVQHQYEDAYWQQEEGWDYIDAALDGSSYYQLPRVLQWFTGNIGFHHIHHLNPRIPNYYLQHCQESGQFFDGIKPLRLVESFKSMSLRLWDESEQRLVGYKHLAMAQKLAGDR